VDNNTLPDPVTNRSRRWTVIAAGLLLSALALVMLYTGRTAFRSPLAIVVIAAIGLAAALLQLRLRGATAQAVRAPIGLNVLGLLCAVAALFSDFLHLSAALTLAAALVAVGCFAVSSFLLFDHLRKKRG
jgi:peptidoglycan/LPS O-acetylase OafA/YrhL